MTQTEFAQQYLTSFNPQQREAVQTVDGPVLLLAVPGSGKTTVLVARLGYMVLCKEIPPEQILTMTYTVAATAEMRQRFAARFGETLAGAMEFRTINGVSSRMIAYYSRHYGKREPFPVIENQQAAMIVSELFRELYGEFPTESDIKELRTEITYIKNQMLTEEEILEREFDLQLYRRYCARLRQEHLMDYDDQMSYALTILKNYPAVLEHFQETYRYLCVDESQDTSKIQHEIIRLLAEKYQNLFMVGDEDQSIYGFRAAYPEALMNFRTQYPQARILLMEENYRSTREIIAAANDFVSRNQFRYDKTIRPNRPSGAPVTLITARNRAAQYQYLFALAEQGVEPCTVLYRNHDSALPLADLLERAHVPYRCSGFEDTFFTHKIVMDVTDIIHFAYNPADGETFRRIYYKMGCPISKIAAESAIRRSQSSGRTIPEELAEDPDLRLYHRDMVDALTNALKDLTADTGETAIKRIRRGLRYDFFAGERKLDTGKLDILELLGRNEPNALALLQRLEELRTLIQTRQNNDAPFQLSTIHAAKGLEFETVYLLDILDGVLPARPAEQCKTPEDTQQYEEDRRLFYVAMTRAKDNLYLFRCQDMPSGFVEEVAQGKPEETVDSDDLFAPFSQSLCGRSYRSAARGQGIVSAQCRDRVLVEYPNHSLELDNLDGLFARRDRTIHYKPAPAPTQKPTLSPNQTAVAQKLTGCSRVTHKTFGRGVIQSVQNGVATVQFDHEKEPRMLMLEICIANGLILPE